MKAQQEPNSLQLHLNSAFRRPFQPQTLINEALAQLEAYTGQLLNLKKKINFLKSQDYYKTTHLLTHTMIDVVFSIQTALLDQAQKFSSIMANLKLTQISFTLFKNICLLIQQSLINIDCKLSIQFSMSMIFQKGLAETFKLCFLALNPNGLLNTQVNRMSYATLDQILHSLNNNQYRKSLLKNVYTLHSGSTLSIQRANFSQNLKYVITNIGKIFTQKTNLITRNLKNIKKTKFINQIVTNSMKTICNYKNHEFINEEINKITQSIFGSDKIRISKQQFFHCIQTLLQPQNSNKQSTVISTFFLYIDLLRVQTLMFSDPELIVNIEKQNQINSSNFYTQEMQKLLKKCPYNGDECCDCKKCQCVRRNRQSAKLSQQKKRNAVQQLDPMKKRIQQLERRNKQLEQQNRILRGIVCELKNSQSFKSAFQSVSKVLNN